MQQDTSRGTVVFVVVSFISIFIKENNERAMSNFHEEQISQKYSQKYHGLNFRIYSNG